MSWSLGVAGALSGAAALVYQVLWSRQLALVLGSSAEAVSVVLSSFMAGLGLGSALAARGLRDPSRWGPSGMSRAYAVLEGGIALGALLLPAVFAQAPALLGPIYGEGGGTVFRIARLAFAFAVLGAPTTAMGATLPLLVALARPAAGKAAGAAGGLYAANTGGAMAGALLTPLALLPSLGVARTTVAAALANLGAGLLVLAASGHARGARGDASADRAGQGTERPSPAPPLRAVRVALAVSFLSGLGALAHETAWTRALALLVGPTPYAFAFVVASVIAGLAVGSALCGRYADRLRRPAQALALVQAGVAACALVLVPVVGWLPVPIGESVGAFLDRPEDLVLRQGAFTLLALAGPAALFGAAFPLCVRLASGGALEAGASVGRVLAWNTAGALLGPLLAGFALLPTLGLQRTLQAAALVHAVAAIVALAGAAERRAFGWPHLAVILVALAVALLPRWDLELLAGGAYRYGHREEPGELRESLRAGELVYYRDGTAATVSVKRLGRATALAVDGKVDATNTADMATQGLLAHLPLLLHASAREALIVGLGSGATAGAALAHPLERVEVVEISPEVVEAARRHFGDVQDGALDDPRLRLHVTDARHHLQLTPRRFDLILSEPSNPWMAGVGSLFTRDFFALSRARLRPGGLFCQWMHVYGMAVPEVRTVVGGFADVFPDSALFQVTEGDLLLVGAAGALPAPAATEIASRMAAPRVAESLHRLGLTRPAALGTLFVLGPGRLSAFAGPAPRHTDDRPLLEQRAARAMLANTSGENHRALLEAAAPPDLEPWSGLAASLTAADLVERGRMLERASGLALALEAFARALRLEPKNAGAQEGLVRIGANSEARALVESLLQTLAAGPDPLGARVSLARLLSAEGRLEEAGSHLEAVLAGDPSQVRALKLVAALQGDRGEASAVEIFAGRAAALAPEDAEAAALLASASLLADDNALALERADRALLLDAGVEPALRVRALALARLQRVDEARAAFERLLALGEGSWTSWVHYGAFLVDAGDRVAALRAFETATDLAPDSLEAWRGLQEAARAQRDRTREAAAEAAIGRLEAAAPSPGRPY